MCHTQIADGEVTPRVPAERLLVPLPGGEQMPAERFGAPGSGSAILLIADVYGPSPFYEHLAAVLARTGFDVLLPDYFFRQGALAESGAAAAFARRAKLDERQTLCDLDASVEWLKTHGGGARAGVLGFCMGGTFALDLASQREDLVTVAYYGFPVPQATIELPPPRPLDLVERLHGPVLAFWGEEDAVVGREHIDDYVRRAAAVHADFDYELLAGLGHGFLGDGRLDDAGDPAGATWQRAVAHFAAHLT